MAFCSALLIGKPQIRRKYDLFIPQQVVISMKLSTRGRYGTRLMIELAKNYGKGPLSMSAISKNQNIPIKYLEQLIIPLKKAKFINSVRGPKGGHMLSKSPAKINVWEVLTLLESKLYLVDCLNDKASCENSADCPIRPIWGKAFRAMTKLFEETTLEDILEYPEKYQEGEI